jgi:extracellular elastinolytic metalloproteinase
MNMFTWNTDNPNLDGSLDNSIPIHEYGHGISNRLTGDSAQANCLQRPESRGMGEGWADVFAIYLGRKESDTRNTDIAVGGYAANNRAGIRTFPYSTNMRTSPLMYSDLNSRISSVHRTGEVWAAMLNEMYWNIVDRFPFNGDWYNAKQKAGNIIAMQLVVSGLKLQPCNPTFITARDAILQADQNVYGGEFQCDIWRAFAKRGLGTRATQGSSYVDDTSVPAECTGAPRPSPTEPIVVPTPSPSVSIVTSVPTGRPTVVPPSPTVRPTPTARPTTSVLTTARPTVTPRPTNSPTTTPRPTIAPTSTLPGVPTSEIPAPTQVPQRGPKLIFTPTRAYATAEIERGQPATIQYDLRRMGRYCSKFAVCVSRFASKETCLVQDIGPRGSIRDVSVTFNSRGTSYIRFVTYGGLFCYNQDTSGLFGYRVDVQ